MARSRKASIKKIEGILRERHSSIRASLGLVGKALGGDGGRLSDIGDAASNNVLEDVNSELAKTHSKELKSIEIAMERLKEGKYGICPDCKKNITMARLEALPYARRCIPCQTKFEDGGNQNNEDDEWGD